MSKVCFKQDCQSKVAFSCNCKANTFLCLYHIGEHMISQGQHVPTPIVSSVDEVRIKKIQGKIIQSLIYYDKIKQKAKVAAVELMKRIEKSCNQLIKTISKTKKANIDLLKHSLYGSYADIETLKKIEEL